MWNRKSIKPPPLCELKTTLTDSDMGTLMSVRTKLKDVTTSQLLSDHMHVLTNEHYILSRFIYKIKNQFRREKSMSGFRQINTCLKRVQEVDIKAWLGELTDCLDVQPPLNWSEQHVYVISRQMIEYYLVRLMGTAALLAQTGNYCRYTFVHVIKHLNVGHLLPQNVVLFAATSRIWYITKSLCLKVCDWYQAIYSCLPFLPVTQVQWLSDDTVLPSNLLEWLTSSGFLQADPTIDKEMTDQASTSINPATSSLEDDIKNPTEDIGEVLERRIPQKTEDSIMCESDGEVCPTNVTNTEDIEDTCVGTAVTSKPSVAIETKELKKIKNRVCSENDSSLKTTTKLNIKTYLESSFRTFEDISTFQSQVKSMALDISGVTVGISKVKRKKILSMIQISLDSIPENLKRSKRRKLFAETVIPELCRILERIVNKCEGNT